MKLILKKRGGSISTIIPKKDVIRHKLKEGMIIEIKINRIKKQ